MLAKWLVNKIFAPVCEIQKFFEFKDGKKKLIVPDIEWNQMNLYDLQDYIGNINGLVSSKQASLQTLYRSLGLNYEEERKKMREEMVNDAIRQREDSILSTMNITQLRSIDPNKDIMEPTPSEESESTPLPTSTPGGEMPVAPGGLPELAPPPAASISGAGAPESGSVTPPLGPGTGM